MTPLAGPPDLLLALHNLHDRFRLPRGQSAELLVFRNKIKELSSLKGVHPGLIRDAHRLRLLRIRLCDLSGPVQSCACCAEGAAPPHGAWPGGYCCGGPTEGLFTQTELAALALAGTRPTQLTTRPTPPAGCIFRTRHGCTLAPAHRPNICTAYFCTALKRELAARGDLDRIEPLCKEIKSVFNHFEDLWRELELDRLLGG